MYFFRIFFAVITRYAGEKKTKKTHLFYEDYNLREKTNTSTRFITVRSGPGERSADKNSSSWDLREALGKPESLGQRESKGRN